MKCRTLLIVHCFGSFFFLPLEGATVFSAWPALTCFCIKSPINPPQMEALSAQIDSVSSGETLISYAINQCAKVQTNVHLPFLVWAAPINVCVCVCLGNSQPMPKANRTSIPLNKRGWLKERTQNKRGMHPSRSERMPSRPYLLRERFLKDQCPSPRPGRCWWWAPGHHYSPKSNDDRVMVSSDKKSSSLYCHLSRFFFFYCRPASTTNQSPQSLHRRFRCKRWFINQFVIFVYHYF